jgi:aspartate aminotransferase
MDFCRWLVREKKVGVAPGSAFGLGGEGHIRLCFAVEEPILREALDRIEEGWSEYRRRGVGANDEGLAG